MITPFSPITIIYCIKLSIFFLFFSFFWLGRHILTRDASPVKGPWYLNNIKRIYLADNSCSLLLWCHVSRKIWIACLSITTFHTFNKLENHYQLAEPRPTNLLWYLLISLVCLSQYFGFCCLPNPNDHFFQLSFVFWYSSVEFW